MTRVPDILLSQDEYRRGQLTELVLARNRLVNVDLPSILTALPCLERLDLSQNLIETLLQAEINSDTSIIFECRSLTRLLLSRNHITDLRPLSNKVRLPSL